VTVTGVEVHVWLLPPLPGQGIAVGLLLPTANVATAVVQLIVGAPVPVAKRTFVAATCTVQLLELETKFESTPPGPFGQVAGEVLALVGSTRMSPACGGAGVPVAGWPGVPLLAHTLVKVTPWPVVQEPSFS
jgi:hypothetical protein